MPHRYKMVSNMVRGDGIMVRFQSSMCLLELTTFPGSHNLSSIK